MVGRTISHYEITEKLGEGGMGVVYKAKDRHLDRFVAIKVLPPERVADPERKRRFVQEAKAASALNHHNIITIHDISSDEGHDYIAMEYVAGKTLDQLIPRKGMRLNEALKCAVQIADALAAAHEAGILHRDLKPGNVMVSDKGQVKVLDFGLAKLTESAPLGGEDSTRTMRPVTEEGAIVGTVAYMSPEQAEGKPLDVRSDIFSFGAVLYEMVTGRRAFQKDSKTSTLGAIIHKDPEPLGTEVPHDLEKVITRCLRKDPDKRFHHMVDVRVALEELKDESDSGKLTAAQALGRARKRRLLWPAVTAIAVVALAAAGVFVWQRIEAKPLTDKDVLVLADFTNTTGDPVFDVTLREALAAQLEQSPFLKILGDEQMRQDLRLMGRPAGERITNQVAREICQRENEKAMIGGSIASLGKTYAITLQATNCQTGEALAREQVEAEDKEHVLQAVATAAKGMRAKLGESLASIQKLTASSEQVTTPSLEAFQAYARAQAELASASYLEAVSLYQRAVELDPNFAAAYLWLGAAYSTMGEAGRCAEYQKKAFALVDRVSERERLTILAYYHRLGAGDLIKAIDACQLLARTYPRGWEPHNSLGIIYRAMGDWERALTQFQEAERLDPQHVVFYSNQMTTYSYLDRFDEAKAVADKAFAQKLDSTATRRVLLRIAYIQESQAEAERHIQWLAGKPEEYGSLALQAANAAHLGQFHKGQELLQRAAEMARLRSLPETVAGFQAVEALRDALVGNCEAARSKARAAMFPEQVPGDTLQVALPLALCGDAVTALKAAEDTSKRFPVHTLWNAVYLPSIRAAVELSRNQPDKAVELLQSAMPYERAHASAVYLRGLAYLRAGKGAEAASEFQKILDHKGANWGPYYPLSYVGLARAAALTGDSARARKAYQDFLALWKDADPDIPILKEAKEEYAKLK